MNNHILRAAGEIRTETMIMVALMPNRFASDSEAGLARDYGISFPGMIPAGISQPGTFPSCSTTGKDSFPITVPGKMHQIAFSKSTIDAGSIMH
jgi:hypothetical protein